MSRYFKDIQRLSQDVAQLVGMPGNKTFFEESFTIERTYQCVKSEEMLEFLLRVRDVIESIDKPRPRENPDQLTLF
jgi:hypothetical protein